MYLEISYIALTVLMILIILFYCYTAFTGSLQKVRTKTVLFVLFFLLLWQVFIAFLSTTAFIKVLDFPPRFALITILPLFIFTGIFIYKNKDKMWVQNIPAHWLIFYQTFRMAIETLFIYSVAKEILHPNVTLEGYNYDMVFAFTAPIVGLLIYNNKNKFKQVAIWWNYLGLGVITFIIFLFITTIYLPEMYGDILPFSNQFLGYPYLLVPAFLMPSAVFVHVLSIFQLKKSAAN